MQFMPNRDQADAHVLMLAREDLKFASEPKPDTSEDHARAGEQHAAPAPAPAPPPGALGPQIATFRPAAVDDVDRLGAIDRLRGPIWSSPAAVRGTIGFATGACIVLAAIAWQSPYGVAARGMIQSWAPQLASRSSPPRVAAAAVDQANSPGVDLASAQSAAPEAAAAVQATAPQAVPAAAPAAPAAEQAATPAADEQAAAPAPAADQTQRLQTMTRDVARLEQEVEQLKAGQAQMARDNAATAEQLKTMQEKMARASLRPPEQHLAKMPVASRRPAAAPAPIRKPAPALTSPQAQFQPPMQAQAMAPRPAPVPPAPQINAPLGPRPPMPVP